MQYTAKALKESPLKTVNFLSKLVYGWVLRIFRMKLKRELYIDDLYKPLDAQESTQLGNKLEQCWKKQLSKPKPSLFKAILQHFLLEFFLCGLPLLIYALLSVAQPVLLANLLKLISTKDKSKEHENLKYIFGAGIILVTLVRVFLFNHYMAFSYVLGMKIRIACCSLLYRKMLRLSHSALSKITAGNLVNLISNDVNRFDLGIVYLHYFWIMPIQIIAGVFIIWNQVGASSLSGILTMAIITIPIQGFLGKLSSKYRLNVANRTDSRVKHMSEIISGIQVIKMYAWEKPFELLIDLKRRTEIAGVKKSAILKAIYLSLIVFTDRFSLLITIVCYTLLGFEVTSDKVFSLAQFFNVLQVSMAVGFPIGVNMGAEILVAITRMQQYLLLDEIQTKREHNNKNKDSSVILKNVTTKWDPKSDWSLHNLNITIHPGALCTVIGPVGSGKSSILHLIIKELATISGTIHVGGDISYASQEPWLFVASVRENILFGSPYDKDRYREVVRVCALEKDFKQFPYGDKTIVGERGISLSGGQRARINLARAVYKQSDIYVLDDPLSAVDAHVSRHLFDQCISDYLKHTTRVLVTHQLQFLKKADLIVVIKEGMIVAQGTYLELAQSNLDIKEFLNLDKDTDESETKELATKSKKEIDHQRRISVVSNVVSTGTLLAVLYFLLVLSIAVETRNGFLILCLVLLFGLFLFC